MKNWQKIKNDTTLKNNLFIREKVIDAIRAHFKEAGFHEMETPLLVKSPGTEPFLEVFETTLKIANQPDQSAYLLTSPEYALKKLLVAGMGNIFEITKSFRNGEGISQSHNSEFTILEWYRTPADYTHVMTDCELLLQAIYRSLWPEKDGFLLDFAGQEYDLSTSWERISVAEAFAKYCHIKTDAMLDEELLPVLARQKNYSKKLDLTWEESFHLFLLNDIEPHLGKKKPTFLYDYPVSQAALSKKKVSDPRFAERFELYLAGLELGNAFSELTDAAEQESRLRAEIANREKLGKCQYFLDEDFITALKHGMPESGGIAVGVDRLVMLFANESDISRTVAFPQQDLFDFSVGQEVQ